MTVTNIMAGICTSSYPIEKVGDSPYPYPYPVNAGIPRQNRDGFEQYPRGQVYLPSLVLTLTSRITKQEKNLLFLRIVWVVALSIKHISSSLVLVPTFILHTNININMKKSFFS